MNELEKLYNASSSKGWYSFKGPKVFFSLAAPLALFSATYFVGYTFLMDLRRKHGQRNPLLYDEMFAFAVLNTASMTSLLGTKYFMAGIITGILQAFAIAVI